MRILPADEPQRRFPFIQVTVLEEVLRFRLGSSDQRMLVVWIATFIAN